MSSLCWRGLGAVGEDGTPRAALNLDRVRDLRPPRARPATIQIRPAHRGPGHRPGSAAVRGPAQLLPCPALEISIPGIQITRPHAPRPRTPRRAAAQLLRSSSSGRGAADPRHVDTRLVPG